MAEETTTTEPNLNINIEDLNNLLEKCEQENRHPTDEEVASIMDVQTMMRLGATVPSLSLRTNAEAWWSLVFVPMGFVEDEQHENVIKLHDGLMSIEEYTNTLSDEEAETFKREFPALQERFIKNRMRRMGA